MNPTDEPLCKPRTHGFQRPFNPYQISTWFFFGSDLVVFYFFLIPGLPYAGKIVLSIFYAILASTVFYICFKCTGKDPTDSVVYSERDAKKCKSQTDSFQKYRLFCTICATHVQDKSKHCGTCNRCAEGFDHHCVWLNNCIGRKNYKLFLKLICVTFLFLLIRFSVTIYLILECHNQPNNVLIKELYESIKIETYWIILLISIIKDPFLLFLLINLILFHLYLTYKKQSTYDFIIQRRKKSREKAGNANTPAGQKKSARYKQSNLKNVKLHQNETDIGIKDSRGDTDVLFSVEKQVKNISMVHLKGSVNDIKRHECDEGVNEEGVEDDEGDIEHRSQNHSEIYADEKFNYMSKEETIGLDGGSKSLEGHEIAAKGEERISSLTKNLVKNSFAPTGSQQNLDDDVVTADQWKQSTVYMESFQQGADNFSIKENTVSAPKNTKIEQLSLPKINSDSHCDDDKVILEFDDEDFKSENAVKEEIEAPPEIGDQPVKKDSAIKSRKTRNSLTSREENHQNNVSRVESLADASLVHLTAAQLRYAVPSPNKYLQTAYKNHEQEEDQESESEEGISKSSRSVVELTNNCKSLLIMQKFNNESPVLSNSKVSPDDALDVGRRHESWGNI